MDFHEFPSSGAILGSGKTEDLDFGLVGLGCVGPVHGRGVLDCRFIDTHSRYGSPAAFGESCPKELSTEQAALASRPLGLVSSQGILAVLRYRTTETRYLMSENYDHRDILLRAGPTVRRFS